MNNCWYVLYVNTGCEDDVKHVLKRDASEITDIKVFKEEVIEQKQGIRKIVFRNIYPGYVFINAVLNNDMYYKIVKAPGVIKILGTRTVDYGSPVPVPEKEMERILGYVQPDDDLIQMSEGILVDGRLKILKGPLLEKEKDIIKLDKRKGRVKVQTNIFGKPKFVYLGVRIKEP